MQCISLAERGNVENAEEEIISRQTACGAVAVSHPDTR